MPIHPSQLRATYPAAVLLLASAACAPAAARSGAPASTPSAAMSAAAGAESRLRADVTYLADDRLEGRGTGTAGNDSSAAFIARRYAELKLTSPLATGTNACQPTTVDVACSYIQPFEAWGAADAHAGRPPRPTQNVAGMIPGSDPALRGQVVVIGAHFDHLGRSTEGALDPQAGDAIRNGADDNASGTAAVMELARRFAANPARRSVLVVNFTGEELGLLGSQHFVEQSPVPVDSMQAMLNFDMVGRLRDGRLIVYGTGTAEPLAAMLESANGATALTLSPVPDGYGPSDHSSFYAQGVPVLHFFTDLHDDYHRATDDAPLVNYAGMARVVELAERVARELADSPQRLQVIRSSQPPPTAGYQLSNGRSAYFGSVPDMGAGDGNGLRLSGVTPGSPADKAGVKTGDVIVQFGDTPVTDLYNYTDALRSHGPGDVVKVVLLRGGERLTVEVTLTERGAR